MDIPRRAGVGRRTPGFCRRMTPDCSSRLLEVMRHPTLAANLSLGEWDRTLRLARRANLIARLAERLDHAGVRDSLPDPVKPHMVAALALSAHQRQAIVWEARHIAAALTPLGMPVILLKGAGYAVANLKAARGRLFGDVDILVPGARIQEVEAALMLHGWSCGRIDPYDDRYYRQWMHELPPMAHSKRGTVIDVHHNILPRTARNTPAAERLLDAAVVLPNSSFRVLAPCDMVIHSATHLFHEGELGNGLRDLLDLADLLDEFSGRDPAFWPAMTARAMELGLEWPLRLAFRYLDRVLGYRIPPDRQTALAQRPLADRMRDALYLPGFRPDHPLCDSPMTSFARALLFLRGHYLRMPLRLLALHLGRKAFMRLYKSTSRSA